MGDGALSIYSVDALKPNSGSLLLPRQTNPCARYWRAKAPSALAGRPLTAADPWLLGSPRTSVLSLIKVGTPPNGPCVDAAAAAATAAARAGSKASIWMALIAGSTCSARAMLAAATSRSDTWRDRTSSARATASWSARTSSQNACTRVGKLMAADFKPQSYSAAIQIRQVQRTTPVQSTNRAEYPTICGTIATAAKGDFHAHRVGAAVQCWRGRARQPASAIDRSHQRAARRHERTPSCGNCRPYARGPRRLH